MTTQVHVEMTDTSSPIPNFFIVGAPKCGTSSMYTHLREHPQVFMPDRKEPHYFAPDLQWRGDSRVADEAEYLALFEQAEGCPRVGEASPLYLYSQAAPGLIKAFSPDARIIIMLRNPADMIYSLYWHRLCDKNEEIKDFAAALEAEADRRRGLRIPRASSLVDLSFYRSIPRYAGQVRRYFEVFGRDRVHVIVFDDFLADTAQEYRKVAEFLNIDPDYQPNFVVVNPVSGPRQPFGAFLRSHRWLHRAIQTASPLSWRRAVGKTIQRFSRRPPAKPPVDPRVFGELQSHFASEVEELGRLLGRDLSHWCSRS